MQESIPPGIYKHRLLIAASCLMVASLVVAIIFL